jgi:hypothetical protein
MCQAKILEGLDINWDKGICKARWTLIWKTYGIWRYERGWNKPKWKTSMMPMDAIHVHAEKGRQHGKLGATLPWDKWLFMNHAWKLVPCYPPPPIE